MELIHKDKSYIAKTYGEFKKAETIEYNGQTKEVFPFVLTSEVIDRDGDIVRINGLNYKNYLNNPVVFTDHETDKHPVGTILKIEKKRNKLVGYVNFHELDEESKQYKRYVEAGVYRSGSIGFKVAPDGINRRATTPEEKAETGRSSVFEITKAELYEFSIVKIPANPEAILSKGWEEVKEELVKRERTAKENGLLNIGDNVMEDLTQEQIEKAGATLNKTNRKRLETAKENILKVLGEDDGQEKSEETVQIKMPDEALNKIIEKMDNLSERLEKLEGKDTPEVKRLKLNDYLNNKEAQ